MGSLFVVTALYALSFSRQTLVRNTPHRRCTASIQPLLPAGAEKKIHGDRRNQPGKPRRPLLPRGPLES